MGDSTFLTIELRHVRKLLLDEQTKNEYIRTRLSELEQELQTVGLELDEALGKDEICDVCGRNITNPNGLCPGCAAMDENKWGDQ